MAKKGNVAKQTKPNLNKYPVRTKQLTRAEKNQKSKKEVSTRGPLNGSFVLTKSSVLTIRAHWKVLLGIVFVYLILNIIFASGISSLGSAVENIKLNLESSDSGGLRGRRRRAGSNVRVVALRGWCC